MRKGIDPAVEELIPLKNRSKLGIQRCKDTLRSWIEVGLYVPRLKRRVRLEGMYDGNTLCTSKEAINRFRLRINGLQVRKRVRRPTVEVSSLPTSEEDSPVKKGNAKPAKAAPKQSAKKAPAKKAKKAC